MKLFFLLFYSVDARGKYMKDAQHWSDDKMMLYGRAHLKANSDKVRLLLEPVLREDEGVYKCRVDFKKSPTRHYRIHLAVISKYNQKRYFLSILFFLNNYHVVKSWCTYSGCVLMGFHSSRLQARHYRFKGD